MRPTCFNADGADHRGQDRAAADRLGEAAADRRDAHRMAGLYARRALGPRPRSAPEAQTSRQWQTCGAWRSFSLVSGRIEPSLANRRGDVSRNAGPADQCRVSQARAARCAAAISAEDSSLAISQRSRTASLEPRMPAMLNHLCAATMSAGTDFAGGIHQAEPEKPVRIGPDRHDVAIVVAAVIDIGMLPVISSPAAMLRQASGKPGACEIRELSIRKFP